MLTMVFSVTRETQPLDIERARIVVMMPLTFCIAAGTWLFDQLTISQGVIDSAMRFSSIRMTFTVIY